MHFQSFHAATYILLKTRKLLCERLRNSVKVEALYLGVFPDLEV
ncbi:hypothetical protein QNH20_24070 [Neobacillus sp. WH10]|nr:hypothetical protein [Neobacillus sp. WH10]WHY77124.1 hypothetical protein QNH20_24070 [Neobacillus sp. WH10]